MQFWQHNIGVYQLQKSEIFNPKCESEEWFFLYNTNYSKRTSPYVQCSFDNQGDFFAKVGNVFAPALKFWHM